MASSRIPAPAIMRSTTIRGLTALNIAAAVLTSSWLAARAEELPPRKRPAKEPRPRSG